MKEPTILSNKFRSSDVFYRCQQSNSGTSPPDLHWQGGPGFVAGAKEAKSFPKRSLRRQKSIVEAHSVWSKTQASPFISTTDRLDKAMALAKVMTKKQQELYSSNDPIYIAVIRPGRVPTGTMEFYRWWDLVNDLRAKIDSFASNEHEFEFLGSIPSEAIVLYIEYGRFNEDEINQMIEDEGKDLVLLVVDINDCGIDEEVVNRGCVPNMGRHGEGNFAKRSRARLEDNLAKWTRTHIC